MTRKTPGGDERALSTTERDRTAAQLREDGHSWLAIAEKLGYASAGHAYNAVRKLLDRIPVEAISSLRATESARMEAARLAALEILRRRHVAISNGQLVFEDKDGRLRPIEDDAPALKALEVIVKISERMARLNGLDAPQQVELSGTVNWTLVGVDLEALT
jgi:hypothetical protein